ncbi:hypothetical protein Cenrod_2672 [Candidatus Symbiobacter mobilis CR]|uniref:Uncharacterized protein n=1 Tax=Candidatus Symbiobacter mobilis CR TaxID=946483 RepID=U5NBC0_9BURK|nr:hypothetical protein Cenrod_2672 [Candidatus Symbiobacter mobilis CR]
MHGYARPRTSSLTHLTPFIRGSIATHRKVKYSGIATETTGSLPTADAGRKTRQDLLRRLPVGRWTVHPPAVLILSRIGANHVDKGNSDLSNQRQHQRLQI